MKPAPKPPGCNNCAAGRPGCVGGCLPIQAAAILAEVCRSRVYELMAREQVTATKVVGRTMICVPTLVAWIDDRDGTPRRRRTKEKMKAVAKAAAKARASLNGKEHHP